MPPLTPSSTHDTPLEHLAGSVERVTFHSEETGFCVLRVKVRGHRDLVTVVGTAPTISPGEYIESVGWWVTDRTHGLQFKTMHLRVVPPSTLEGIERYLGSGQVRTPMNRGSLGARALNVALQAALNPDATPRVTRFGWTYAPGDKVIQTINDYDKDTFNGDIGQVVQVDLEEGEVVVHFDGRAVTYDVAELDEVALAYAITVHKSQGSEYPAVVIPLATQHYPMLVRRESGM